MEEAWRSSQPALQEEVDAIVLVHPINYLKKILEKICGKLTAQFVLIEVKSDLVAYCNGTGIVDINICEVINSFLVFFHEISIDRLVRGGVLPCVASKRLLLLHVRFCYNFVIFMSVRTESLLSDVSVVVSQSGRSRRNFEQLLNLDDSREDVEVVEEVLPPIARIEDEGPFQPLERITDQDPGLYLLDTLIRSGATTKHLLPYDEPVRPVELEEELMFGMPPEYLWDTEAIINWLPEDHRPSSLFPQEGIRPVVEPEQVNNLEQRPAAPDEERVPAPRRPRVSRAPDNREPLSRTSKMNYLDNFLKHTLKKRSRERNLEYQNHLKMLREDLRNQYTKPRDPIVKCPCPFSLEEIAELLGGLDSQHLPEPEGQHLGDSVFEKTMASDLSTKIENFPLTPDVVDVMKQQDNITPIAPQNLPSQPDIDMEQAFIENAVPTSHDVLPQIILPDNVLEEPLRIELPPAEQILQPAPSTRHPEAGIPLGESMQGIEDNVEEMMQNLFHDAALTVTVFAGDTSFVHTLPTNEIIEPEPVEPQDNIAGRLRPVRPRRLVFDDSPPTSPPRRKRRRRRQSRQLTAAIAVDAYVAPHQVAADAIFDDDLGVQPLAAIEPPAAEHQVPDESYGRKFLDTPEEVRKQIFIGKLKELQIEHGDIINFLQICPYESTLRAEATVVFQMLIELCHAKHIELIQEVAYAPEKLFVKIL